MRKPGRQFILSCSIRRYAIMAAPGASSVACRAYAHSEATSRTRQECENSRCQLRIHPIPPTPTTPTQPPPAARFAIPLGSRVFPIKAHLNVSLVPSSRSLRLPPRRRGICLLRHRMRHRRRPIRHYLRRIRRPRCPIRQCRQDIYRQHPQCRRRQLSRRQLPQRNKQPTSMGRLSRRLR